MAVDRDPVVREFAGSADWRATARAGRAPNAASICKTVRRWGGRPFIGGSRVHPPCAACHPHARCGYHSGMDEKSHFLKIWNKEAAATRAVLSRIPEGSDYRPDPKSRTAREIAWLIVREEKLLADGLEKGVLEWEEVAAPKTMKEVLD